MAQGRNRFHPRGGIAKSYELPAKGRELVHGAELL